MINKSKLNIKWLSKLIYRKICYDTCSLGHFRRVAYDLASKVILTILTYVTPHANTAIHQLLSEALRHFIKRIGF